MEDVAVMDDVVLAFLTKLAGFAGARFAIKSDKAIIVDGLGLDKAALKVRVDDASGVGGRGSLDRKSVV